MCACSVMSYSFMTPWTVAHWTLLSMGFSRQEYWIGLSFLPQGIFPTRGSNPRPLCLLLCRQVLYQWRHLGNLRGDPQTHMVGGGREASFL